MAIHTHSQSRAGQRQGLSRPPTSPHRAPLRVAPAALLLLFFFMACSGDAVPTRPTVEQPVHAVLASVEGVVVNSPADPGDGTCDATECTLREAIAFASPGATITISVTGDINIEDYGFYEIDKDLTITGLGAGSLTLHGSSVLGYPLFSIVGATVTLSQMTLTGGSNTASGGAIAQTGGTLTLVDMVVSGNSAGTTGGGIRTTAGTLNVENTTVSGNSSAWEGGGIAIQNASTATVSHSTISGNSAGSYPGGGISNMSSSLTVAQSTVSGNSAGYGAGVFSGLTGATATITNSTISGNTTPGYGGGVYGGAGLIRIDHSTIASNQSSGGGGVYEVMGGGINQIDVKGSIIWGNTSGATANDVAGNASGLNSLGYNLVGAAGSLTSAFDATGDQTGVADALLGALADNDGPTETHALLEGSPAVDADLACTDVDGSTVTVDQRDVGRPQGDYCDKGAYEGSSGSIITTTFTFDLLGLPAKRYQSSPDFSVAGYASSNSPGAITFALGAESVGCTVTPAGSVHITGAAVGSDYCIIVASQADALGYTAATPISQQFNIAKGITYISISNLPESGNVGEGFGPTYSTTSSGDRSTTSSTTSVCTVSDGYVSFIGVNTCTLVAHVAETTNWAAADGAPQDVVVSAALLTPAFTFDLSSVTKTYGDAPFSVAGEDYVTTNSSGDLTFALGASSVGCSVADAGMVTITGAATGEAKCEIAASLAADATYAAAGPISASFNIAKATPEVSIGNLPTAGVVGNEGFTPEYTSTSDGDKSTTSSTTGICTVDEATGLVSFIAAGTCTLVAHVAEGTNWLAADGQPQDVDVLVAPDFTFDLSRLRSKTYGDAEFSVVTRRSVSTNSSGEVTFTTGEGSVGCSVTDAGIVTITGAAVGTESDPEYCIIEASLERDGTYASAGPISQSFHIERAATTVSIDVNSIPAAAEVGGDFRPDYTTTSDGATSTTSSTPDICTVDETTGLVSFIFAGQCTLVAHVQEGTNWLAAEGDPQSFAVGAVEGPSFSSSCTYSIGSNGRSKVTVDWENANPGVTLIVVYDGRDLTKQMAPSPSGSWSTALSGEPTGGYGMWGGYDRKDSSFELVAAGTACEGPPPEGGWTVVNHGLGTPSMLKAIWGSAAADIFVGGTDGEVWHYDGTWTAMTSNTAQAVVGIWGSSSSDVYAAAGPDVVHYGESGWAQTAFSSEVSPSPCLQSPSASGVWGSSATNIYFAGDCSTPGNGAIYQYDGSDSWTGTLASQSQYGVWGSGGSDVFSVGFQGVIRHYNGEGWTVMTGADGWELGASDLYAVWGASSNDVFAVGAAQGEFGVGIIVHYNGTAWSAMEVPAAAEPLHGVWGTAGDDVFAVGEGGTILHYNGTAWSAMESGTSGELDGVWGSSGSDVYAVGQNGTILHYGAGTP